MMPNQQKCGTEELNPAANIGFNEIGGLVVTSNFVFLINCSGRLTVSSPKTTTS